MIDSAHVSSKTIHLAHVRGADVREVLSKLFTRAACIPDGPFAGRNQNRRANNAVHLAHFLKKAAAPLAARQGAEAPGRPEPPPGPAPPPTAAEPPAARQGLPACPQPLKLAARRISPDQILLHACNFNTCDGFE